MKSYFSLIVVLGLACFAPSVAAQVSSGTAFAVAPELLITNQHVVARCSSIDVVVTNARRSASIVDADAKTDLALLRVSGLVGATARLRTPPNIRLGESVMVFGFPLTGALSSDGNFTAGLVSALRGLRDTAGTLQITAPVQPGSSGGPLMDSAGLVIGVVQAKLDAIRSAMVTGDIPQNVNFAISAETLTNFLSKNRVAYDHSDASAPLDTARVAQLAQSFTYRVDCKSKSQQASYAPSSKRDEAPPAKPKSTLSKPEKLNKPSASDLARSRQEVVAKLKETIVGAEKLLALHEAEVERLKTEYQRRRGLYQQGLIGRREVEFAEQALIQAMGRVKEDKRWLAEAELSIKEIETRDKALMKDTPR